MVLLRGALQVRVLVVERMRPSLRAVPHNGHDRRALVADPEDASSATAEELPRPSVAHTVLDDLVATDPELSALDESELADGIAQLRRDRGALILAHNYERPEIQDVADRLGDSLDLARFAARSDAPIIVFCGVRFMAETASLLCPGRQVLLPEPAADCSLAASVTVDDVRGWRSAHPDGMVVAYINTHAEVKAKADWCCTSANATRVVEALPVDVPVLFLPDLALGQHAVRATGRPLYLWRGRCHVHAEFTANALGQSLHENPGSDLLVHPESIGLTELLGSRDVPAGRLQVSGTGAMVRHAPQGSHRQLVATETGLLHRLAQENPRREFVPVVESAVCDYMKATTLTKLYRSLRDLSETVTVPEEFAAAARVPLERMMSID